MTLRVSFLKYILYKYIIHKICLVGTTVLIHYLYFKANRHFKAINIFIKSVNIYVCKTLVYYLHNMC